MRILLTLLLFTLPALAPGQDACPDGLQLKQALFTTGIRDRQPQGEISQLPDDVPAVYFFTRVVGGAGERIHHIWSYGGDRVVSVPLPVGGDDWRTWSSKNLGLRRSRDWTVQVTGPGGCVLGSWRLPAVAEDSQGRERITRIREMLEAGDLAGARMETKQALADNPAPALRKRLETLLAHDLELARVAREIEQNALYTARSRLDALLASPLEDESMDRARALDRRLEGAREGLRRSASARLADLAAGLNATLAGGRPCQRLSEELAQVMTALLGADHPFLVTARQVVEGELIVALLDRRSGDSHEMVLSCLPSPLSPLPASPPSGD